MTRNRKRLILMKYYTKQFLKEFQDFSKLNRDWQKYYDLYWKQKRRLK